MNLISEESNLLENPKQRHQKWWDGSTRLAGLALLIAIVVMPQMGSAATNHGSAIFKNPVGPTLEAKGRVGDTIIATIRVRNMDSFGDSLTITSIVDVIHHALGGVETSPNLLTAANIAQFGGD